MLGLIKKSLTPQSLLKRNVLLLCHPHSSFPQHDFVCLWISAYSVSFSLGFSSFSRRMLSLERSMVAYVKSFDIRLSSRVPAPFTAPCWTSNWALFTDWPPQDWKMQKKEWHHIIAETRNVFSNQIVICEFSVSASYSAIYHLSRIDLQRTLEMRNTASFYPTLLCILYVRFWRVLKIFICV